MTSVLMWLGVAGLVGVLMILWFGSFIWDRDAGDATERTFSIVLWFVLGASTVLVVLLDNVTSLIGEAPGMVSALVVGALGYVSLSGLVDVGPQLFALLVTATIIGTLAVREA